MIENRPETPAPLTPAEAVQATLDRAIDLRHQFDQWSKATEFTRTCRNPVDAGDQMALRVAHELIVEFDGIVRALAALHAAPAVADSAAARWHADQMALYRRLETLAKDEEFRGVHRDAGLITDLRFKAEMHEQAARALSRPGLPEPEDDDETETCETCQQPITGQVVRSWDDVPLCEECAELPMDEAPIPAHHYRCDDAYGCDWHGAELVPEPDGVLRCPACSSVAIIEPPSSTPASPPPAETRLENAGSKMLDFIEQSWRAGLRAHPEDEPEDAGSLRGRWFLRGKAFAANERAVLAYPSPPSAKEGPTP